MIDIGNTHIVAGVYRGEKLVHSWRIATHRQWTSDEVVSLLRGFFQQEKLKPTSVKGACVSSVVPPLIPVFEKVCLKLFKIESLVVSCKLEMGIQVKTDVPAEVGADRLVNAAAAFKAWGGPLVLVDMGTAITVDAVNAQGHYLGGAIAPGVNLGAEALVQRTAKLPRVELDKPLKAIGSNTIESIRSGVYHGAVGQVREIIKQVSKNMRPRPKIIATGGWASWMPVKEIGIDKVDMDLTLKGLKLIWKLNQKKKSKA